MTLDRLYSRCSDESSVKWGFAFESPHHIYEASAAFSETMTEPDEDKYKLNPTPDLDIPSGVYIPTDIYDAIRELEKMLHPALIEKIKNCSGKHELVGEYHYSLGMWIRNNWGLWQESRLAQHLASIVPGFESDYMSSFILECFWKHLNGQLLESRFSNPRNIDFS